MSKNNIEEEGIDISELLSGLRTNRDSNYILVNEFCERASAAFREDFFRLEQSDLSIIPIFIDSYGGDIYSLMSMLSLIHSSKKNVATICDSKAFSAGAILLSSGTPGMRFCSPYAHVLIHQASLMNYGKFSDIAVTTDHCSQINSMIFGILNKNAKKKVGFFEKLMSKNNNADLYFSAQDAQTLGIVDHVHMPRLSRDHSITDKLQ